jgi:hypothetical protein
MTSDGGATADLSATIWPQVDRALAGISAEPEMGVLDLIVRIPREEVIRGLRALKRDAELDFDYLRCLTAIDWEDQGVDIVYHLYCHRATSRWTRRPPSGAPPTGSSARQRRCSVCASTGTRTHARC